MSFLQNVDEAELANCFPLHKAAKDGNSHTVVALLETDRNLAATEDRFLGWTPAHWAAYFGKLDCLRNLIYALPNGVNVQTSKQYLTVSHCAADAGQAHCLLWLLQAGANPNMKDLSGETALHKCARTGSAECASLLIQASCNVRAVSNAGKLASAIAEENGHHAISVYINQAELVQELNGRSRMNVTNRIGLVPTRMLLLNRKRRFEDMDDNVGKRLRFDDMEMGSEMICENDSNPFISSTSVIDHEKLCTVEESYMSSFLHCVINDFHGC